MPYPDEPGLIDENIQDVGSSGTGTQAYSTASVETKQTSVLLEVLHDLPGQDPLIPIMTIDSSENDGANQNLCEEANQNDVVLRASKISPPPWSQDKLWRSARFFGYAREELQQLCC